MSDTALPKKSQAGKPEDFEETKYLEELKSHEILLLRLDHNKARAWEKYIDLRLRLKTFFECRGCIRPIELADQVLDRVSAILGSTASRTGEEIREVPQFCIGVARKIQLEAFKREKREAYSEDLCEKPNGSPYVDDQSVRVVEKIDMERRLACLKSCLARLKPDDRNLVLLYYSAGDEPQIRFRKDLAKSFKISLENLRKRARVIRVRLEACVRLCLES